MDNCKRHNRILLGSLVSAWLCLFTLCCAQAQYTSISTFSSSGASCKTSCGNSTCTITTNANGTLPDKCPSGTRYDVDPNCIMNQNAQAGSCIDTMPVSSIKRVSETNCYRANGAGGNPKPRNHAGTDYSATEGTVVTAAADGEIVWAKWMGGGGRVIVIEHQKQCKCTAGNANEGCDDKYVTIYMHLRAFLKDGGSVTKGQPIGLVGGSNYSSSTGASCDWPNKKNGCSPYGPHLHFEIHSGSWDKGYTALKKSIINPLCDDIQNFCGGCSYDVGQCQGKTGTDEWQELSDEAAKTKSEASAVGSMTPEAFGADANSVYSALSNCSLEEFLPKTEECWFCPIFRVLFNTASTMALKAYTVLADGVTALVIVGFAIWVSIFVLKHVSAVEVKSPSKMIQTFLLQTFKVLVVVIILKLSFFQIMRLTLEPVFNTGMAFTQTITGKGTYNSSNPDQQSSCSDSAEYMQNIIGYDSSSGFNANSAGGLPVSMGKNIVCSIKSMQDSVGKIMAYGRQAMCVAWKPKAIIKYIIPSFPYLITGIVLYLGGLILLLAFPWCLIDCVIQMSVAAALAPAAIGAWAFKITSSYLGKIWNFFMNAMFNFVFLSIILYIIMTVVDQFVRALNAYAGDNTGWDFLVDPINGLAYWGVTGMKLVVVCLMGWVFLDEGKNFADKFAKGAPMGGIGRSTGGTFAQVANKAGKTAFRTGKAVGAFGMTVADHTVGAKFRKMRDDYRINHVKKSGTAIRDDDGNIIGYEKTSRNLRGQSVTRRVDISDDGKEVWSKEKQGVMTEIRNNMRDRANQRRTDNLVKNGEEILDEDGNVIGYQMSHKNLLRQQVTVKAIKNDDGTFNLTKEKNSLRMQMLAKMTKDGSKLNQFAKRNMVSQQKNLNTRDASKTSISSDKFLSIRKVKDRSGNVIQENVAFNDKFSKYLLQKDGTLHMDMINKMKRESNFDEKTINQAIALYVMKARGININSNFNSRDVSIDKNGVMRIKQTNVDGSVTEINSVIGGKNGNQMITEVKTTKEDGSYTAVFDNGVMKRNVSYNHGDKAASASYAFADEYYRRHKYVSPLNGFGHFAAGMDQDMAMFGFGETDLDLHSAQIGSGKAQAVDIEYTSIFDQPATNGQ